MTSSGPPPRPPSRGREPASRPPDRDHAAPPIPGFARAPSASGSGHDARRPRIGRYEVVAELGRGGMGAVYEGWDPALARSVAIKVLRQHATLPAEDLERFRREAQLAARIRHPNVVEVYAVETVDDTPFLVMELVRGRTLGDLFREGIELGAAVDVIAVVAQALHHAHLEGVIHRDVKPANIIVDAEGKPRVADFGLAYDPSVSRLTASSDALGTPSYMAPEQVQAKRELYGPATDVYALGAILYRAACGRPPFEGSSMAVLASVLVDAPTSPRELAPETPPELEEIILRCLAKEAGDRYPSANELARALERHRRRAARGVAGASARADEGSGSSARLAAIGALVLALVVIVAVLFLGGAPAIIQLDAPAAGARVGSRVEVRGRVTEGSIAEVWIRARPWPVGDDGAFIATVDLEPGAQVVAVMASPGGATLGSVSVHVDARPPEVTIVDPPAGQPLPFGEVVVRGRVEDAGPATVTAAGRPVEIGEGGAFTITLRPAGFLEQVIEIVARDDLDNETVFEHPIAFVPWWTPAETQIELSTARGLPLWFDHPVVGRFVLVPAGSFTMGSPATERGRADGPHGRIELPHRVTLTEGFYVGVTEMTNAQFRLLRPKHDSGIDDVVTGLPLDGDDHPVVRVPLREIQELAAELSKAAGREELFRLPTEAEWEWAARAGTTGRFFWGEDERQGVRYANATDETTARQLGTAWGGFPGDDGFRATAPVGSYVPNAWGLFDVVGNAWELTLDAYAPYQDRELTDPRVPEPFLPRTARGGSFGSPPSRARMACRHPVMNRARDGSVGFRLIASLEAAERLGLGR